MTRKQKSMIIRLIAAAAILAAVRIISAADAEGAAFFGARLFTAGGYAFTAGAAADTAAYLIAGYDIIWKAVKNIAHGQVFDENFLMMIASVGAMALGERLEGCAVMVLYQVGELFQSVAVGKSRRSISELMDIRPDTANVETGPGKWEEVDAEDVRVGTVILVKPGERIPIDGIVREGKSALDTSALTGESLPREAAPGETVLSGCLNMSGALKIETTAAFGESTASKILDLVENAGSRKSESEKFITKFARYYTPAVCAGALVLAVLPPLIRMYGMGIAPMWSDWVFRALTFLVISCPCALVISIPLSFFGGIGGAGRQGILIKGSNFMETLSNVTTIAFDKTGTVTKGNFEVTDIRPADGVSEEQLLEYAAYIESFSSHPISGSLRRAYDREIDQSRVTGAEEIGGHGVTGKVDGVDTAAGNLKLMRRLGIDAEENDAVGTVVYVAADGKFAGSIVISDEIKQDAAEAMRSLKDSGVKRLVMLTGDNEAVADDVAARAGIDEVRAELLPADKVESVEELIRGESGKDKLAFVGDGINDAPVLSRADIGIAMGALGSDAAIEAADVVLMDDDPVKISKAIRIARKCLRIVKQNIVFAIGVKAVCLVLGALGIANMWMAIFADTGVMIIAVINAGRALMVKNV
ncbi:MAG: heavy metal translocating P-type ATPase [Anaerovoracaceae bacterium]|jgi:Cd2+/Zn2+-exporting ATPase